MNIQKTYYFVTPLENARKAGAANRAGYRKAVLNALQRDWALAKIDYKTIQRSKAAAADRSQNKWNFERLDYERKRARDFLQGASLASIRKRYSDLEMAGDTHALRAFAEEGAETITGRRLTSGNDALEAQELKTDMQKMVDDLTVTQEMRDLKKQGQILTEKIVELYNATEEASELLHEQMPLMGVSQSGGPARSGRAEDYLHWIDAGGNDDPFKAMLAGVHVNQRVNSDTAAIESHVKVDGWD